MAGTIWDLVLGRIETKVNNYSYHAWFRHTALLRDSGSALLIRVADPPAVDWMNKHYTGVIAEALSEVGRTGTTFTFIPEGADLPSIRTHDNDADDALETAADLTEPDGSFGFNGLSPR